jgi:hypothetical protein
MLTKEKIDKMLYYGIPDIEYVSNNECSKALDNIYELCQAIDVAKFMQRFHTEIELPGVDEHAIAMAEIARQIIKNIGYHADYSINKESSMVDWIISWS